MKWWHYQLFYWSLIALGVAIINDFWKFVIWSVGAVGLTVYLIEGREAKP